MNWSSHYNDIHGLLEYANKLDRWRLQERRGDKTKTDSGSQNQRQNFRYANSNNNNRSN